MYRVGLYIVGGCVTANPTMMRIERGLSWASDTDTKLRLEFAMSS